ncbi:MAG: DUF5686 family protein [Candidatus Pedobacter colombiensis]|uniref:DUF5686 family protein n=1 Tax=Candidatus Pedobacter colombiensis TaxID=3121371 RepID=A0AAJ6B9R6_9SPHI|nr:DUF5686 family protein [Pedobacter sp.]WEK20478.1 MAG: DUF5686 family protein [Pedobacter sp.]
MASYLSSKAWNLSIPGFGYFGRSVLLEVIKTTTVLIQIVLLIYTIESHYVPEFMKILSLFCVSFLFLFVPLMSSAQSKTTTLKPGDNIKNTTLETKVAGQVLDAASKLPLADITVEFIGNSNATQTDDQGKFVLSTSVACSQIKFSHVDYKTIIIAIKPGQSQIRNVFMEESKTQLQEVMVNAGKKKRYHNKDNPAVTLIEEVIAHKESNRMLNADYLQYDQYERIGFSLFDLSKKFLNSRVFNKYKFLLDTSMVIDDSVRTALPVYMAEKYSEVYSRREPAKKINMLKAHKEVNYSAFIDNDALDFYLNRLYGTPDIYANNIFILTNQFLSPIADHAQDFYKYFITDTIKNGNEKLIEISFTPRNLGDLLFEGKLYITMDGRYAVKSDHLEINKHININFVRRMDIDQDFKQYPDGRFYLVKSNVKSDFGLMKAKGLKIFGDRTVFFSNYKLELPKPAEFYEGKSEQQAPDQKQDNPDFWATHRTDTLRLAQTQVYHHLDSLQNMPSFKRTIWMAKFVLASYADLGPVELGPNGSFYSFNPLEGSRVAIGGRTTSSFNQHIYLEGYTAYGFKDEKQKFDIGVMYSFNGISPQGYPNNYFKVSYQYDTDIPGENFLIDKFQSVLGSITRGRNDFWQYNRIFKINYIKDLDNHLSYNLGFKHWNQQPVLGLIFQADHQPPVHSLTTSELQLDLRYAPNEQIFRGTERRHTIPNKYPIFSMEASYGMKGVLDGSTNYLNLSANISKRFYLSQLGYTDMTLLGGTVLGKVPFPYLAILPANQTYLYDWDAYNNMNFLEFVSDHYVGLNATHAFGGFLLNKVPLIKHLKLREFLTFKILYGGLRNENNPVYHSELYKFPVGPNGTALTFPLGSAPYMEIGVGIGNIFKVLQVDLVRRLTYLDHNGVTPFGLRFTIAPGF